jgi:accessory gene regulator B
MSYSKLSERTAARIAAELNYDNEKRQIIAYSIENLLLTTVGFVAILAFGAVFGTALYSGIAAAFGGLLRRMSGGAHFDTPVKCLTFGTVVYGIAGVLSKRLLATIYSPIFIIFLCVSLILVLFYAPVDSKAKPIRSESFRRKLKLSSIAFVLISVLFVVFSESNVIKASIVFGIFYQSLTLLPSFNREKEVK